MKRRVNLYKVVDQNGKAVFEDLLTAKQVTEKLGIARDSRAMHILPEFRTKKPVLCNDSS